MEKYLIAPAYCADDMADAPDWLAARLTGELVGKILGARAAVLALQASGTGVHGLDIVADTFGTGADPNDDTSVDIGRGEGSGFVVDGGALAEADDDTDDVPGAGEELNDTGVRVYAEAFRLVGWGGFSEQKYVSGEFSFEHLEAFLEGNAAD